MKIQLSLLPVALAAACAFAAPAARADGIDFHGYFRVQAGGASKGGNLQCFQIAPQKFRLGNECDNYAEPSIGLNFGDQNKVWGKWTLTTAVRPQGAQDWEDSATPVYTVTDPVTKVVTKVTTGTPATQFAVREDYFSAGGFFGRGALQNASLWVGKRFYNRHDVHMNDNYYYGNSGLGGGIEGIDAGVAKISLAYIQNGLNGFYSAQSMDPTGATTSDVSRVASKRYAVRFYDLNVNPGGKLEGELVYLRDSTAGNAAKGDGTVLYLEHSQDGVFGGFNKLAFVYGDKQGQLGFNEPGTAYFNGKASGKTWRIIEQLSFDVKGTGWTGTATALYAHHDKSDPWGEPKSWTAFGVRPQYNFTDNYSVAAELGYDRIETYDATNNKRNLLKLTVAPQVALSRGVWARPVLRAYATYAKWNDAVTKTGIANGLYGTSNNGMTFGVQAEAWW